MAIVYWENFDGVDHNSIMHRADYGRSIESTKITTVTMVGFWGRCLRIHSEGVNDYVSYRLPGTYSQGLLSFALRLSEYPRAVGNFCALSNGLGNQLALRLNMDMSITVLRNTTEIGTSIPIPSLLNRRTRLEIGFVISPTEGSVDIRVNTGETPVSVLSIPSTNTEAFSGGVTNFQFHSLTRTVWFYSTLSYIDDLIFDTDPAAFRPDFLVETLVADSDIHTDGTPSAGENFECVSVLPFNSTSYVQFTSPGNDRYSMATLAEEPSVIYGVGALYRASKTISTASSVAISLISSSEEVTSSTNPVNVMPRIYTVFSETDPADNEPWTKTAIDNLTVKLEVS